MQIAIQMDELEKIHYQTDSTYILAREGQKRGYSIFVYQVDDLYYLENSLRAKGRFVEFSDDYNSPYSILKEADCELNQFQALMVRQDPPFDMNYLTATYLLEQIKDQVLILNDPLGIRNAPEKLSVLGFKEFIPPTLMTRNIHSVEDFLHKHKKIVLKPLYGNGGESVFVSDGKDQNLYSLFELLKRKYSEQLIIQKYIDQVQIEGDKRVLLVDGEPHGVLLRKPSQQDHRANLHVGGKELPSDLTPRDQEICDALKPFLIENGLFFVGIDIIGGFLTEINVTSPTGIREINRLNHVSVEKSYWDKLEKKIK